MKMTCTICGKKIRTLQIFSKEVSTFQEYIHRFMNLEYIGGHVEGGFVDKIVYQCDCGLVTVNKSLIRNLDVFLHVDYLKCGNYGTLKVEIDRG